ncbi:large-conductance mechanosensitive channel protein MscL [Levilactobacillus zymae]|uniref:large-conductance mechanosensitive channel protein MscL n=1 Tax=Levilactobacillus zymae TaxID=267363 RepID=UPI0028B98E2A|nr:large-conductance mechanosensitive channel protein MscL [Levilactobacillus zymae]MDT6980490.1 large-conductance mechanosensitive channel protein MscL [Levilactobacillus zymae]
MLKEFKEFIARGNVMDLAVGVIVGAAFTAIVNSLVKNLINPLLGIFVGSIDFSNLVFTVGDAHFRYGAFINSIINFLIIAFVVFLLVKFLNRLLPAPKDDAAAEPSAEEKYLKEIVDLLKKETH